MELQSEVSFFVYVSMTFASIISYSSALIDPLQPRKKITSLHNISLHYIGFMSS